MRICQHWWRLLPLLLLSCGSGCAALTNPVAEGIPVRRLPTELLGVSRVDLQTIPLTLLEHPQVAVYRLAPGDVLGVYIDTILGERNPPPPVHYPELSNILARRLTPSTGFPISVRDDGTIGLPLVEPIRVEGLTLPEAETAIRQAYNKAGIFQPGKERMLVTLGQQRTYHITVIRQESGGFTSGGIGGLLATSSKRGTGHVLDLPAYENDVLTAIALTGGLPGLDALNEIIVFKACQDPAALAKELEALPPGTNPRTLPAAQGKKVVVIPVRLHKGQKPPFCPEDVVLNNGDVVFVEQRDWEIFYTGGLLPADRFTLPRDVDLDVVDAVSFVKGSLVNGAFGGSNLSGTIIPSGYGQPSPSLLTVIRHLPDGSTIPIRVDLNRALCDARERILVQPRDTLILQETPEEALARYFTQTFFNFTYVGEIIHSPHHLGVIDIGTPDRLNLPIAPTLPVR
jgi:hypothetical protein